MSEFNYIYSQCLGSEFLSHHGIKGQKWGVKNGPPYPIQKGAKIKKSKALSADDKAKIAVLGIYTAAAVLIPTFAHLKMKLQNRKRNKLIDKLVSERTTKVDPKTGLHLKDKKTSPEEDMHAVNPFYEKGVTCTTHNCANCSIAFEMRRRGYDVVAQLSDKGLGTTSYYKSAFPKNNTVMVRTKSCNYLKDDAFFNSKFVHTESAVKPGKQEEYTKHRRLAMMGYNTDFAKETVQKLKTLKNQRGFISMGWGFGGSHVMNYENKNGKITLYDSQTSTVYTGEKAVKLLENTWYVSTFRTDNSDFNINNVKRAVK